MLGIIKEEMNRAMKSKGMLLALTIGITIVMIHIIHYIISFHYANQMIDFEKYPIIYPATVCDKWIEGNTFTMESFLYFLLLPIIAVLPFGTSYLTDNQSGFLKGIYMRISRKKYLIAKYISSFVAGGIAVILPLSVNLMCALIFLPNLDPQVVSGQSLIRAATVFHELYYSNPLIYLVLFFGA